MTPCLTPKGYALTKMKLANMATRLAALRARDDMNPIHKGEAERSYLDMMGQYQREIEEYETAHPENGRETEADQPGSKPSGSETVQRANE